MNFTFHVPHPIMNSSKWLQSILSYFAGKNFFFLCQTMLNDSLAMRQHFNQFHYFTQYIEVWLLSKEIEEELVQLLIGGVCLKFVFVILLNLSRKSFNLLFGWITLICSTLAVWLTFSRISERHHQAEGPYVLVQGITSWYFKRHLFKKFQKKENRGGNKQNRRCPRNCCRFVCLT